MLYTARCTSDDDYAEASLFLLAHKRSLHPSFSTMDVVQLLYSYITDGHLVQVTDDNRRIVGLGAYYVGTPERDFADKEVAFVDVAIAHPEYRGTRVFLKGLAYMVACIRSDHPDVREMRLAALAENEYNCKLYAKFARFSYRREGSLGEELVFTTGIEEISAFLTSFYHV
jgi:hypothetical protein